jgi:hypothetical protein
MNSDAPRGSELTFRWGMRPRSIWRLSPYLLLCVATLASLAFIFKEKPASPTSNHRVSQAILLLDPSNPINQTLLNKAHDTSSLVLAPEPTDEWLSKRPIFPVFRTSFHQFRVRLKEPHITPPTTQQIRLFQPSDLALPPVSRSLPNGALPTASSTKAGAKPWLLTPQFHGSLASRTIQRPPELDSLRPQDLAKLRFQIAVKPDGRTLIVIPIHSATEDREILPTLQRALASTRFEGKPGTRNEWGQVSFSWTIDPSRSQ